MSKLREFFSLNKQDYNVIVSLNNGTKDPISFQPFTLEQMVIEDDFLDWYLKGFLIINNPFDQLERKPFGGNTPLQENINLDYKFRTDCRDILKVTIIPDPNSRAASENNIQVDLPDEIWKLEFEAVIYNTEDMPGDHNGIKKKKLYFWEKEYQIMLEKSIEFSTSQITEATSRLNSSGSSTPVINDSPLSQEIPIHKKNNNQRSVKTGEALLELLKSVKELEYKIDSENWQLGNEENKIFYTSPTKNKIIDDVNYIISRHTSEKENDISFLRYERSTDTTSKKFTFKDLSTILEEATPENQEDFFILDLSEDFGQGTVFNKSPEGKRFGETGSAKDWNEIQSYDFIEMSGIDNALNVNVKAIHNYNSQQGQFNYFVKDHTPEIAKEYIKTNYLSKIEHGEDVRFQLNNWKKDGYNITHTYTNRETDIGSLSEGRNKMLFTSMFTNIGISFNVLGLTTRQAGKFFSVKKQQYNDTDFDHRLEGQYLAIRVVHNFNFADSKYENSIIGAKLHVFLDSEPINEDDELLLA